MPRARCPASIEAEKRYNAGELLKDIAASMKVPGGTVRRWKSTQDWDGNNSERSETKANARKTKTAPVKKPKTTQEKIVDKVEENDELTDKQKLFCVYFLSNFNATQSYLKAYQCSWEVANVNGPRLLGNARVSEEIKELKKIRNKSLANLSKEDVVEMHMKIAFANVKDYMEFHSKTVPVLRNGVPVMMTHPKTKEEVPVTKTINVVKLRDSAQIDGQLVTEVSEGREGAKIKLADRQKSLDFLARYFELNPMDKHRKVYDSKRYELEVKRFERGEAEQSITGIEDMTTLAELLNDDNTDEDD